MPLKLTAAGQPREYKLNDQRNLSWVAVLNRAGRAGGLEALRGRVARGRLFDRSLPLWPIGMLAAGDRPETILDGYPWLEMDDIQACLLYAKRLVAHERVEPLVIETP